MTNRRTFLRQAVLGGGMLGLAPARVLAAPARFDDHPFSLGVASGFPTPQGVVLWTRLAPYPLAPGGGMPPVAIDVTWEVAEDDGFRTVVRKGTAIAAPEWAHSVHVEVDGLMPEQWYFYRFRAGNAVSPTGRTRTAPSLLSTGPRLRFAFASCQHYEQGYYGAYRHMLADDLDLVVFLGDYIYETNSRARKVRDHVGPVPKTLDEYRQRHALYKTDPDLQAMHAAAPWLLTWDDHEVENNYANDRSDRGTAPADFLLQRAAAYRAYYEHMPLPRAMLPRTAALQLYSSWSWGKLAGFHLLDDRQYRAAHACGYKSIETDCLDRKDPGRTMLGPEQERWFDGRMAVSTAQWNIVAQQTLFSPFGVDGGKGHPRLNLDSWDGYPAARQKLIDTLVQRQPANPVLIGGDVHSFFASHVQRDPADPDSPVVATEFVTSSISSVTAPTQRVDAGVAQNPHIQFGDSRRRGYARVNLTPQEMRVELRAVETVERRESACETVVAFAVGNGKVGMRRV